MNKLKKVLIFTFILISGSAFHNFQPLSAQCLLTEENIAQSSVQKWIEYYTTEKGEKYLHDVLENGMEYRLFVRKAISERELPLELEYLPVVESAYKASAKSRSGALGLWQFMSNSVRPFLTLNEYVDERLDPWRETEAALSKLSENYNYFKVWTVAIGAYNCGNGAMSKAIKKAGTDDFWTLSEKAFLTRQTAEYVPKLIAIAELAENPEKYEISLPHHDEEYEVLANERDGIFDYITVEKAYSISTLAMELRIDEKTLKKLNPALIKGFTPPAGKYKIRLPLGTETAAKEALAKMTPIEFPFKHKVEKGESLWSISRKYGVTVKQLCDLNGIEENAILRIGKILYIPGA